MSIIIIMFAEIFILVDGFVELSRETNRPTQARRRSLSDRLFKNLVALADNFQSIFVRFRSFFEVVQTRFRTLTPKRHFRTPNFWFQYWNCTLFQLAAIFFSEFSYNSIDVNIINKDIPLSLSVRASLTLYFLINF